LRGRVVGFFIVNDLKNFEHVITKLLQNNSEKFYDNLKARRQDPQSQLITTPMIVVIRMKINSVQFWINLYLVLSHLFSSTPLS